MDKATALLSALLLATGVGVGGMMASTTDNELKEVQFICSGVKAHLKWGWLSDYQGGRKAKTTYAHGAYTWVSTEKPKDSSQWPDWTYDRYTISPAKDGTYWLIRGGSDKGVCYRS